MCNLNHISFLPQHPSYSTEPTDFWAAAFLQGMITKHVAMLSLPLDNKKNNMITYKQELRKNKTALEV